MLPPPEGDLYSDPEGTESQGRTHHAMVPCSEAQGGGIKGLASTMSRGGGGGGEGRLLGQQKQKAVQIINLEMSLQSGKGAN